MTPNEGVRGSRLKGSKLFASVNLRILRKRTAAQSFLPEHIYKKGDIVSPFYQYSLPRFFMACMPPEALTLCMPLRLSLSWHS